MNFIRLIIAVIVIIGLFLTGAHQIGRQSEPPSVLSHSAEFPHPVESLHPVEFPHPVEGLHPAKGPGETESFHFVEIPQGTESPQSATTLPEWAVPAILNKPSHGIGPRSRGAGSKKIKWNRNRTVREFDKETRDIVGTDVQESA